MKKRWPIAYLAAVLAVLIQACSGGREPEGQAPQSSLPGRLLVQPSEVTVAPGGILQFSARSADMAVAVAWQVSDPAGGAIDGEGRYVAPPIPGTYYVVASATVDVPVTGAPSTPQTVTAVAVVTVEHPAVTAASDAAGPVVPTITPTPEPRPTPVEPGPATVTSGTYLFGTRYTPNNRPISDWEPDIRRYYSLAQADSIVDAPATADLQGAFGTANYGTPYVAFGQDSYAIYYASAGDPEYPVVSSSGSTRLCPLDASKPWGATGYTTIRVPAAAAIWSSATRAAQSINPAANADTDVHFTIVDVERNRVYAFYSYGGEPIGIVNGRFESSTRACDLLKGDDAAVLAAQAYSKRYGCAGGSGYPGPGCGVEGIGAGISAGLPFGNGDSNGFNGPHGVIMPQDFDDTGWTGEAVGTLHHALRCSAPVAFQYGYMWPMQNPESGTAGRSLRDGQIFRLDPTYDVEASGVSAAEKRLMRTLQRYGCVLSDYGSYGMELFALSGWAGAGPNRGSNPWTAAGGANAEAQSFYTGVSTQGIRFNLRIPTDRMQVIRPHGASYPAR